MKKKANKTVILQIRITPLEQVALLACAKMEGIKTSEFLRLLIRREAQSLLAKLVEEPAEERA